jgi:hypothetical protein
MGIHLPQMGPAVAAAPRSNREQRRQTPGVLFEQIDTQQFLATRQRTWARECSMPHELFPLRPWLTPVGNRRIGQRLRLVINWHGVEELRTVFVLVQQSRQGCDRLLHVSRQWTVGGIGSLPPSSKVEGTLIKANLCVVGSS